LLNWAFYDTESNDIKKALGMDCPQYLEDDALVIQIRSGDIFRTKPPPHLGYKQPPVAFYEKIFQTRKWKSITFVTEMNTAEHMNPVWLYYNDKKNRQTNMIFQNGTSFKDDLHLMTCSHYFVAAHSSLFEYIIYIAPPKKTIYTFVSCESIFTSNIPIVCNSYDLMNYVMGTHGNWTNSPEQREEMFSYDIKNIVEREGQVNKEILNEVFFYRIKHT
jgi:hypothetical protein